MDERIGGRGCSAGLTYLYYAFDSLSGLIGWNDRLSPAPPLYSALLRSLVITVSPLSKTLNRVRPL